MRRRLDAELVRRGLVTSRARAADMIAAGRVRVSGAVADKPSRQVAASEPIVVAGEGPRFVSRAGDKLDRALDRFIGPAAVVVAGGRWLDAGASTGGFTDCLLQRGAASVVAVDVGRAQLDDRLRNDPRVTVRDGVNLRHLVADDVGGPVDGAVADLSFISLRTVAPALVGLVVPEGPLVVLVKPQFEAGPARVGRGGIVRDPAVHRDVLVEVLGALRGLGLDVLAVVASSVRGASGNVEFLARLRRRPDGGDDQGLDAGGIGEAVAAAVADAAAPPSVPGAEDDAAGPPEVD